MKLIDPLVADCDNAAKVNSLMHWNRNSLLALLLTMMLVAVQTVLPWMHVGCQHDHSQDHSVAQSADGHGHHHCRHHHHRSASQPAHHSATVVADHRHDRVLAGDCAACRFLLLSPARCEPAAIHLTEQVAIHLAGRPAASWDSHPVGLYRSRAPPALS